MAEKIVAAAICIDGLIYSQVPPARHHTILDGMIKAGVDAILAYPDRQGFVTSTGRFVQREEAAQIAIAAKQIEKTNWGRNLYSEDMW